MILKSTTNTGGSHWYYPDGKPCYTVARSDGKGSRDTNLRDAKKLGLVPSVTTILKILAKPGLDSWKVSQGILSALTLPRAPGESLEEFAERIARDSQEEGKKAAQKGTDIHDVLEVFMNTGEYIESNAKYVLPFKEWLKNHHPGSIKTEENIVGIGYAGKCDFSFVSNGVKHFVDYKSQAVKKGKPNFYDEYCMQLTAYSLGDMKAVHINLVIDRDTGELFEKIWTPEECEKHWKMFQLCRDLFYLKNNLEERK